jgi:hypothetical protein
MKAFGQIIKSLFISQKLTRAETKEAKDHLLAAITTHSVISWAHITLLGEYDFSDEKLQDSVGILPPKTGYIGKLEVRRRQSSRKDCYIRDSDNSYVAFRTFMQDDPIYVFGRCAKTPYLCRSMAGYPFFYSDNAQDKELV